jgi:hypothetical protein
VEGNGTNRSICLERLTRIIKKFLKQLLSGPIFEPGPTKHEAGGHSTMFNVQIILTMIFFKNIHHPMIIQCMTSPVLSLPISTALTFITILSIFILYICSHLIYLYSFNNGCSFVVLLSMFLKEFHDRQNVCYRNYGINKVILGLN